MKLSKGKRKYLLQHLAEVAQRAKIRREREASEARAAANVVLAR